MGCRPVEEQVAAELSPLRIEFVAGVKKAVSDQVEDAMRGQIEPLRSQLDNKDREIAELQDCLADHDRTMFEAVSAIGETCREAVSRISGPRFRRRRPQRQRKWICKGTGSRWKQRRRGSHKRKTTRSFGACRWCQAWCWQFAAVALRFSIICNW